MESYWIEERSFQRRILTRLYAGEKPHPADVSAWTDARRKIEAGLVEMGSAEAYAAIEAAVREEKLFLRGIEDGELSLQHDENEDYRPLLQTILACERLRWLHRVVESLDSASTYNPGNVLGGEIVWARNQAREIGAVVPSLASGSQEVEAKAGTIRARLQGVSIDGWIKRQLPEDVASSSPDQKFRREWRRVLEYHDIVSDVEKDAPELDARLQTIRDLHSQDIARCRETLEVMEPAARQTALVDAANALEDQGASFISEGDLLDASDQLLKLETVAHSVGDMEVTVRGFQGTRNSVSAESANEQRVLRKRLGRLRWMGRFCRRRSRSVEVDSRLNQFFGRLLRRRFENLIFFLILLLVGLVALEWRLDVWARGEDGSGPGLSRQWKLFFQYADLGICSVLLADFFMRWHFARWRFWFVRSHFLLDFLPALPYGFLFGLIEMHAAASATGVASSGSVAEVAHLALLVRLVRVARSSLPFLRVFARAFRLVVFVLRGLDRIVQRFRGYLDRNILLFESEALDLEQKSEIVDLLEKQESRGILLERELYGDLRRGRRTEFLAAYLRVLSFEVAQLVPEDFERTVRQPERRDIHLEAVVSRFVSCDAVLVENVVGLRGAERVSRTLSWIDVPLIRSLPVFRRFVSAARMGDPLESSALATREVGHFLQKILAVFHVWGDLSGITTGPQILDRVSTAMIRATQRPAVRLLIFGVLFIMVYGVAELMLESSERRQERTEATVALETGGEVAVLPDVVIGLDSTEGDASQKPGEAEKPAAPEGSEHWFRQYVVNAIGKILGLPLLILGTICLLINAMGRWLKRIAGEALDVYLRTSEAHFFPLLKLTKLDTFEEDLEEIRQRVFAPECRVRDCDGRTLRGVMDRLAHKIERDRSFATGLGGFSESTDEFLARELEQVSLLYRDYLESSPMRRTEDPTSVQILGNMAMRDIRVGTLGHGKKEIRRLEKLALEKERLVGSGPYLWFRLISESLSIETAKLVLEYNSSCIPRPRLATVPGEQRARFERFLDSKQVAMDPAARRKLRSGAAFAEASMLTTEFNALHFLMESKERDASIGELFGEQTREAMIRDRRAMVRDIFGTWPYHRLPRSVRRVNPYRFYFRYLAGARILLLPFVLAVQAFGGLLGFFSQIIRIVREVLGKAKIQTSRLERVAGFDVATRKINRMRKPYFMEAMKLRAAVDVEYLGLRIPGLELGDDSRTYRNDLDFIGALEREGIPFESARRSAVRDLRRLRTFLQERGWLGTDFAECLKILDPGGGHESHQGEILRGLVTAFVTDSHGLRTTITGPREIRAFFNRVIDDNTPRGVLRRCWQSLSRGTFGRLVPEKRRRRRLFEAYVAQRKNLKALDPGVQRKLLQAFLEAGVDDVQHCEVALEMGESQHGCDTKILEALRRVVAEYPLWSRKLVTLRMIQTLTILDTRNYRDLIWSLGGFEEDESRSESRQALERSSECGPVTHSEERADGVPFS